MRTRLFVVIVMVLVGGAAAPWNIVLASPECPNVVEQGFDNTANTFADCATVSGGYANIASFGYATVSGGYGNDATSGYATAGGGYKNAASGPYATVGGGYENFASGDTATVGGGERNTATSGYATVGGGSANTASGDTATVSGGYANTASFGYATVGGGNVNTASSGFATVGGGDTNIASGNHATVGGGNRNAASGPYATVGGGIRNTASGPYASVGGGYENSASANGATVGGGVNNTASFNSSTVGGGYGNSATAQYATIGGGGRTNATDAATGNRVTDNYGTVGGGGNNQAGDTTTSNRAYATVAGGRSNTASGTYATVAGGFTNLASGNYSFAAGRQAKALHTGSFVWGDSAAANIASTGANQFIARASGGVTFYSTANATAGVRLEPGAGAWSTLSDRNSKANITAVDSASILERLASIPIQLWNYKAQDASVKHIGPMAQDFAAAFGVGENDTTISTVDADGVALAAIQGLHQENQQLKARVATLEQAQQPTVTAGITMQLLVMAMALTSLSTLVLGGGVALVVMQVRRQRTSPA